MRTLALGDIHGGHRAMLQVFERSNFDHDKDQLVFLGDIVDGWPDTYECIEELMNVKNLVFILGNHDEWALKWFTNEWICSFDGTEPVMITPQMHMWVTQGGKETIQSYVRLGVYDMEEAKHRHAEFFKEAVMYHIDKRNNLYVHGGINWHFALDNQPYPVNWDRHMWETALTWQHFIDKGGDDLGFSEHNEVFIGHTATVQSHPDLKPVHASNLWNLDQGAGWHGKLTIMDVDTHEYWQSDEVGTLYPEAKGRR